MPPPTAAPWPASMQALLAPLADRRPGGAPARATTPASIRERPRGGWGGTPIPHADQFAAQYNAGRRIYWSRFDEALRDNWQNALAMRRSAFIHELLRHRQLPVVSLPWRIQVDDPKDPDQQRAADRLTKLIQAIPRFQAMRLYLAEDKWYGKYGAQLAWGEAQVDGRPGVTVTHHEPVDGDSIVFKFDRTPGILVRTGWLPEADSDRRWVQQPEAWWVQQSDRARALFLYDRFWRDHFVISEFEPSAADFLFEGDKAGALFGRGLRDRVYWDFQFREELRTWTADALQRFGTNGLLYAFYEAGDVAARDAVVVALKQLLRDNVTAFPKFKGEEIAGINHIPLSQIGYEILLQLIDHIEECIRRAFLGQTLSGEAQATGLGSKVAELHESTFDHIIRYDAGSQADTLTRDLLGPMVRFNEWQWKGRTLRGHLPFTVRFAYVLDKANVEERAQVIRTAYDIGLPLDSEKVYEDLGLSPPKDPANALVKPQGGPAGPAPGEPTNPGAPGAPVPQGAPGMPPNGAPGTAPRRSSTVRPGLQVYHKEDGSLGVKSLVSRPAAAPAAAPAVPPVPAAA